MIQEELVCARDHLQGIQITEDLHQVIRTTVDHHQVRVVCPQVEDHHQVILKIEVHPVNQASQAHNVAVHQASQLEISLEINEPDTDDI